MKNTGIERTNRLFWMSIFLGILCGLIGCGTAVFAGFLGMCVLDIASWPVALPFFGLSVWAMGEAVRCFWRALDSRRWMMGSRIRRFGLKTLKS